MDKRQFMEENNIDANGSVSNYFKKAKIIEEKLGKDLAEWNASEIIDFYKLLCTPSMYYLNNIHCTFRKYTSWCQSKGALADNINHYDEITTDTLLLCINKNFSDNRIISREELLNVISELKIARDQFVCLALFEGFAGKELEEIRNVRLSNFNGDKKNPLVTLTSQGKTRQIPYTEELYEYARRAAEQQIFDSDKERIRLYKYVGEPDQVVKKVLTNEKEDTMNTISSSVVLYRNLKNIQKITQNPAFTSKALKESGRIHMVKELMQKDSKLTMEQAIKNTYPIYGRLMAIEPYINKYNDFLR